MYEKKSGGLADEIRRLTTVVISGALAYWLASLGNVLFKGKISLSESLASFALFAAFGLLLALPLRLLAELSGLIDKRLERFKVPAAIFVTLASVYPLAVLLITRRSWSVEFLGVSLLLTCALFPLLLFAWRFVRFKALWLITALFSTWLFFGVVENEGLLMRAGEELLDLPTLVLFVLTFATAVTALLLARLAASLAGEKPFIVEAALLAAAGLGLALLADDVIDVHYENIFQVTVFFAFAAVIHGVSIFPQKIPLKISAPLLTFVLVAGALLVVPFDGKPKGLSLVHSKLAEKNRCVDEIFQISGLAEGEQRLAACRLHKLADYPEGKFARRFEKSLRLERHRPTPEELTADPARRIINAEKPWNFLFITVDSLRYDKTGYSGLAGKNRTPAFDKLAGESQRFHQAFPQGAWTTLSVPAFLWSRYPSQIKYIPVYEDRKLKLYLPDEITDQVQIKKEYQIPADKNPNLPTMLGKNGFKTISVTNDGNTGFFDPRLGMTKGFMQINYPGEDGTDIKALEQAEAALISAKDSNFFMWVHFFDVHGCHMKPKDPQERKRYRSYNYRVRKVDEKVGRLLDLLEDLGLKDNTVVILTGDHGQSMGELKVRGHGLGMNDASLHVPLLIRIPGLPPVDYQKLVSLIDLAPTVFDLAGMGDKVPPEWMGTSLAPMLAAGKDLDHPPVRVETWRNKVKKKKRYLYQSALLYEGRKVAVKFDDMKISFYGRIPRNPLKEKMLYPEMEIDTLKDYQLYMVKFIMNNYPGLVNPRCR